MSDDKKEFDRNKTLIDGSLKNLLDDKKISKALIENSIEKLNNNKRIYIFSDCSDTRKPYSSKLEKLGKVRDLQGNIINGYSNLGSVILDENKKNLTLSNITVFSNRDDKFIGKEELKNYHKNKLEDENRVKKIEEAIKNNDYINTEIILQKHLKEQSVSFKKVNPNISICHVYDRAADDIKYFEFVRETLQDDFIVRVKKSRNSNQFTINPETKRKNYIKLIDAKFANEFEYHIDKLTIKGKLYQQIKIKLEWDKLTLNKCDYSVVRISLFDRNGNKIHKQPMLLITSIAVNSESMAKEIYHIYLLRAKIESVFKFLKDVLGWEEFQVRDWESIKNIIAICFFIGGYFYEIESELIDNKVILMICDLAKSKGKITRFFFLEGLKVLLTAYRVDIFRKERNISDKLYAEMQSYAGIKE